MKINVKLSVWHSFLALYLQNFDLNMIKIIFIDLINFSQRKMLVNLFLKKTAQSFDEILMPPFFNLKYTHITQPKGIRRSALAVIV